MAHIAEGPGFLEQFHQQSMGLAGILADVMRRRREEEFRKQQLGLQERHLGLQEDQASTQEDLRQQAIDIQQAREDRAKAESEARFGKFVPGEQLPPGVEGPAAPARFVGGIEQQKLSETERHHKALLAATLQGLRIKGQLADVRASVAKAGGVIRPEHKAAMINQLNKEYLTPGMFGTQTTDEEKTSIGKFALSSPGLVSRLVNSEDFKNLTPNLKAYLTRLYMIHYQPQVYLQSQQYPEETEE